MNKIDMAAELFVSSQGEIVHLSDTDAERARKTVLSARDVDTAMRILEEDVMSQYLKAGRFEELLDIIDELCIKPFMEPAVLSLYLKQGSTCENMRDYDMAIDYYSLGIQAYAALIGEETKYSYWLFNNSAFCHGYERIFLEAEKLANKAISIDREKHNAWKNLGISLEHQDRYIEAAACYLASFIKCGGGDDSRPMKHLTRMFERHEGLKDEFAGQAEKEMGKIFCGSFTDFSLGEAYYHCGHFDKAVISYEKFYESAPSGYGRYLSYSRRTAKELKELVQMEKQFT